MEKVIGTMLVTVSVTRMVQTQRVSKMGNSGLRRAAAPRQCPLRLFLNLFGSAPTIHSFSGLFNVEYILSELFLVALKNEFLFSSEKGHPQFPEGVWDMKSDFFGSDFSWPAQSTPSRER
jgi:hypothetical protein